MCTCNRSTAGAARLSSEKNVSRGYSTSFATDSVTSSRENPPVNGNVTCCPGERELLVSLPIVFEDENK
jgi:hypothetical protein